MNSSNNLDKYLLHILIVEDDPTDTQIILGMLEQIIYKSKVTMVENGLEALDFLETKGKYSNKEETPHIDLILLDVHMPEMDGITFVNTIKKKERLKDIPIIVFTTEKQLQDKFSINGVNDYVLKSIDGTDLIKKINRYTNIQT